MASPEELRSHLSFGPANKSTIGILKLIHKLLLPIHYSADVYDIIRDRKTALADLAYLYGDTAVGEVSFRVEEHESEKSIYLMTIGVLPTYQRLGFGRMLVDHAIEQAKKVAPGVTAIYLHVHVENAGAMEFYRRLGFTQGELREQYYKSLDNEDAYLFSRRLEP
jgi:ribosomal protein S18 acetylase RimI-like enzyme